MRKVGHKSSPESLAKVLSKVLTDTGLDERLDERKVLTAWVEVVGEEIAEHVRPLDIFDGVLVVDADHGVWRQEITLLAPTIINRFNDLFGEETVREIRWRRGLTNTRRPDKRD